MKKLKFFFCLTIVAAKCVAQWLPQNSGTNENLYDIEFINLKTGWAVGDAGVVLKTTNGGSNWINIPNPSPILSPNLWSVAPIDSNIVYVTSSGDFIMKTTNGGMNWNVLHSCSSCNSSAIGIYFLNKDTGWILGSYKVFRTYDGGQTLDSLYAPWFQNYEIYFKDINTGIFTGDGRVFKTTNGGVDWFNTNVPTTRFYMFRKIAVVNNSVWLASSGDAPVFYSQDFCESWSVIDTIDCYPPSVIYSVAFANENTGWAGGTYGWIYKSTNAGYSWLREETSSDPRFWGSIYCFSDSIVWGVGGAGKIQHTTTGGQTITKILTFNQIISEDIKIQSIFPNPSNLVTNIKFSINKTANYILKVYDLLGRESDKIFNKYLNKGEYEISYNASHLSSGMYYFKLSSGNESAVMKFVLLK